MPIKCSGLSYFDVVFAATISAPLRYTFAGIVWCSLHLDLSVLSC